MFHCDVRSAPSASSHSLRPGRKDIHNATGSAIRCRSSHSVDALIDALRDVKARLKIVEELVGYIALDGSNRFGLGQALLQRRST